MLAPALDVRAGAGGPTAVTVPEQPGTVLEVRRRGAGADRLLLVHHFNPDGRRAQLVRLR